MNRIIHREIILSEDPRLKRHIHHDSKSWEFKFNTTGLLVVSTTHSRYIPILNQGQVGSCTGNAGEGNISTSPFPNKDNKIYPRNEFGALKLYGAAQVIDGNKPYPLSDTGSSGLSIAKALLKAGLISSYQHTFSLDDALKAGSKYPFITGTYWYDSMYTPETDGRVHPLGKIVGGHEYLCREIDAVNKKVWFDNSWGDQWGIKGRFYMTFDDYGKLLQEQGDVTILMTNPILKNGSKGQAVINLQNLLNGTGANLMVDGNFGNHTETAVKHFQAMNSLTEDGVVGPNTWEALQVSSPTGIIISIITDVCNEHGIDPALGIAVASAESGLDPHSTLYNPNSKSTDRGLFQWNSRYHSEITDEEAFDPTQATILFCKAVKDGKLHLYWSASEPNWKKHLSPEILMKYGIV